MRVLNPLRKVSTINISVLKKFYAVDIDVYFPAKVADNNINGHLDMLYKDEPSWTGKGLCPSYFKYRDYLKASLIDPFQETPDIILWTDIQEPFPIYSKIIFKTNYKGISAFKIDNIVTEGDDEGNFIHKHFLVPIYEVQESHNKHNIIAEYLNPKDLTDYDETKDTTTEQDQVSKYLYNPIK